WGWDAPRQGIGGLRGTPRPLAGAPNPALKGASQRPIERIHLSAAAQCGQAGDPMLADAAGDNSSKMRQIRCHIDAEAVRAHPAPQPDADGGDLVLSERIPLLELHPDADKTLAGVRLHAERSQGVNDQCLKRVDEGAYVGPAGAHVEHHVADPLAGAVIGELAATAGTVHGKSSGLEEICCLCAGAGGVERGMLEEPDELACLASRDGIDALGHEAAGLLVCDEAARDAPLDGC